MSFDTAGTVIDKFQISTTPLNVKDYAIGPNSDHYFLANFASADSIIIGGQTVYYINPGITYSDILLFKFDSGGNLLWIEQIGDTLQRIPRGESLMVTATDDLYVGGSIFNDYIFGNDTMFNTIGNNFRAFPFLAKYTNLGQALWGIGMSTQFSSEVSGGISELPNGNIVYCGYFINSGQIASINLTGSGKEIFIAEVSPGGAFLSVEQLVCSGGTDHPESFTTDNSGNMYVGGGFAGTFTFNGTSYTSVGGATDAFVAKYGYICTVGVDDELPLHEISVNIYPNPVSDVLHIHTSMDRPQSITIMNMLGEIVMESTSPAQHTSMNVSQLPPGIYLVQVNRKSESATVKFVKIE